MTCAKLVTNGVLDLSGNGWTTELPALFSDTVDASDDPCPVISRSSSPNTQAIWIMALPNGLVLSMPC
jgi:hypothetical protein